MKRLLHTAPCLLALLLLLVPVVAGDKDIADLLCEKGEKAARGKNYEEAVGHFERALDEHSPHPEASYGLAKALEKLGRTGEALDAYLACLDGLDAQKSLSRSQKRMKSQAAKAVKKLGKGYAELAKMDKSFVSDMLALGKKHFNSEREWSKKAFETVLLIDPENELAKSYLDRLKGVAPPAEAKGLYEAMVESDGLKGWKPGLVAPWTCQGGVMAADTKKPATNFRKIVLKRNYSLRATLRCLESYHAGHTYGLIFAQQPKTAVALLITGEGAVDLAVFESGDSVTKQSKIIENYRPKEWLTLRADIEDRDITVFVNGKKLFRYHAEVDNLFDGSPGVTIQRCRAEIRNVEVQR